MVSEKSCYVVLYSEHVDSFKVRFKNIRLLREEVFKDLKHLQTSFKSDEVVLQLFNSPK